MRKLERSVAKSYARELGMQHMNKRRSETKIITVRGTEMPISVRAKSAFGVFYQKLGFGLNGKLAREVARIEKRRWQNALKAVDAQEKSRSKRQAKLNAKAVQFPIACGA